MAAGLWSWWRAQGNFPQSASLLGSRVSVLDLAPLDPRRGLELVVRRAGRRWTVGAEQLQFDPPELAQAVQRWREALGLDDEVEPPTDEVQRPQLVILLIKGRSARCREVDAPGLVTLRAASLAGIVPGQVVSVLPRKTWMSGRRRCVSGVVEGARIDPGLWRLPPLQLRPEGPWSPEAMGARTDRWAQEARRGGPRTAWELETPQPRLPELSNAPLEAAADAAARGDEALAQLLRAEAVAADLRCLDGHAALGRACLDDDLATARRHFEVGVAAGRAALLHNFRGVLPWTFPGNRPFLRNLLGLGLAAWRQGDLPGARQAFDDLLRLAPDDPQEVHALAAALEAGQRYHEQRPRLQALYSSASSEAPSTSASTDPSGT